VNSTTGTVLSVAFWTLLGFFLGALPFAVWLGRLAARVDVRRYGDGNPGTFNAWRAAGWRVGLPVLLLDFLKGALPVGLAHFGAGINGWGLVPIGLAPVLGHAFSPLLHGRGGKGIAVTFGVWTGLAMPGAPIVLGLILTLCFAVHLPNSWAVLLAMLALLVYILVWYTGLPLVVVWIGNVCLLAWKFRRQLGSPVPVAFSTRVRRDRE
jgi:acyl phosphate:glycerol-3-phosphate acyltransferase